jgi:arylsulfatase A-like enzyme
LTGVHVPVHGVIENTVKPHKSGLTVYPDVLQERGYKCFLIGKSHFVPVPESFTFTDIHTGNTDKRCDDEPYADGTCKYYHESDFLESYLVDSFEKHVGAFLDSDSQTPVFVHLSFVSPHPPSTPPIDPKNFAELYSSSDLPSLNYANGDIAMMPYQTQMLLNLLPRDIARTPPTWILPDGSPNMTNINVERLLYYGLCAYVDEQVGRAVDFIDVRNLTTSTFIIFTSDHGSLLYSHGGNNEKHSFYDEVWHVPLIFRWPGSLPKNATAGFASTVDVTAAILVAGGVDWEGPSNRYATTFSDASLSNNTMFMAGLDILTPLREAQMSSSSRTNNDTYTNQRLGNIKDFDGTSIMVPRTAVTATQYKGYGVVTDKWKLLYFPEQGEGRLFDRGNDPCERRDLFGDSSYQETQNILLVGLLRWRAQQDDLQWELAQWSSGAEVGARARNDSCYLTGRAAEYNLQDASVKADTLWRGLN